MSEICNGGGGARMARGGGLLAMSTKGSEL